MSESNTFLYYLFSSILIDVFLLLRISPNYFRFGIPIFWVTRKAKGIQDILVIHQTLEYNPRPRLFFPRLVVNRISANQLGFRDRYRGLKFRPLISAIVHHKLVFDPETHKVRIVANMNWSFLLFIFWLMSDSSLVLDGLLDTNTILFIFCILPYSWQALVCHDIISQISNFDDQFIIS